MRGGFSRVKGEQLIVTFLTSTLTSPPPLSIPSHTAHRSSGLQSFFNSSLSRCYSSSPASPHPSIPPFPSSSLSPMPGAGSQGVEWPADRIRDTFFRFFEEKNHVYWNSSPVVPVNDPTLLFANAGLSLFFGSLSFLRILWFWIERVEEFSLWGCGIWWGLMGFTKILY